MLRIGIAAVVGGIVLFVWASISWTVIPWHMPYGIPGQDGVAQALLETGAGSGIYWLPSTDRATHAMLSPEERKEAENASMEQSREGPAAVILYKPSGVRPYWITMVIGFVLEVLVAAVAAFLLSMAAPALPGFMKRVGFVVLLSVFMIFGANLMNWNYMLYPFRFTLEMALDGLVAALLLGIVLAIIIRPSYAETDDADDFPADAEE